MDRESFMPLVVSALLAVALHASVFFWPELSQVQGKVPPQHHPAPVAPPPALKPELPKPPEPKPEPTPEPEPEKKPEPEAAIQPKPLEIGRDGEPVRSTVAWIPYDDFKELMAAQSLTIQPAFQQQADAVADAPIEMNPSTPRPTPVLIPNPTAAAQQSAQNDVTTMQPPSQTAADPAPPVVSPASPEATTAGESAPESNTATATPSDSPSDALADSQAEQQVASQQPESPASSSASPSTPSSAPDVALNVTDVKAGSGSELSIPPGPGDLPLAADDSTTKPLPADSRSKAGDAPLPDLPQNASASTSPEQTPSPAADDTRRLALAPLKVPRESVPPQSSAATSQNPPATAAQSTKAAAASTDSNEARPTSVPRSDRESIATQTAPMPDRIVLGKVLVSDGIEIKTARPQINISTLYTASPRNPVATIVFDKTGQVVHAQIIRSSGFADVDSPVLNSLYRWRASGKKLQEHKSDTFTIARMTLLFVEERKTSSESVDAPDTSGTPADSSDANPSPDSAGTPDAPAGE